MTEKEIFEGNKLIAEFMGYIYYEPNVTIEYEYSEEIWDVYSKTPILVEGDEHGKYFCKVPNPDYGNKDSKRWSDTIEKLCWSCINEHRIDLQYHASWDWLMKVIDKIEDIGENEVDSNKNYHFNIGKRHVRVIYDYGSWSIEHSELAKDPEKFKKFDKASECYRYHLNYGNKLETTWFAVVDFIKWYNERHPK
jgi:hypothetical protein